MDFEVGDICKLRNGDLVVVTVANYSIIWGIHCRSINDHSLTYLFNNKGQYDLYSEKDQYDIVKILPKDKYPEMYI